jgi:hypothetical protein
MTNKMTEEQQLDLLMSEDDVLNGMLEAADFKTSEDYRKKLQIVRNVKTTNEVTGEIEEVQKKFFEFTIRPLDETELYACRKGAMKRVPSQRNKNIMEDAELDFVKYKALKIYAATVGEDGKKIWDNPAIKKKLNTLNALDVINETLTAGEKDWIDDVIDEISGYGENREEQVKN